MVNHDFTITSDNCRGAHVYQDLYLKYASPFVGISIDFYDYLKLLNNLEYYLKQELRFANIPKDEEINNNCKYRDYPIGKLGDIELQMVHYKRRVKRINFFKSSEEENALRKEMYMYPIRFDFVAWLNEGNKIFKK